MAKTEQKTQNSNKKETEKITNPRETGTEKLQGQSPTAPAWPVESPPYQDRKNPFRGGRSAPKCPEGEKVRGQLQGDFTFTLDKAPEVHAGCRRAETLSLRNTELAETGMGQEDGNSTCHR